MSIKSTLLMIMIAMCTICTFAQAQHAAASSTKAARPETLECDTNFSTELPYFCVTENGNIQNFIYPTGYSQIYTDGYGVCDYTGGISYFDAGVADSGNWNASVSKEPGGPNTLPLIVTRTTSDGIWTITQIFSRNTTDAYVKVEMTLKNNTKTGRSLELTRYVDIDADSSPYTNYFDGSINAGWGYQSEAVSYPNHGLTIRASQSIHNLFGYNTASGNYDPCNIRENTLGVPAYGDEAVVYAFAPNGNFSIPGGKSVTVTLEYRPM
jgi:hypothetical protein